MSPRNTEALLQRLTDLTISNRAAAQRLAALPHATLHLRPRPDAWNAVECFAHLNYYSDYYLPEMRRRMATSIHPPQATYTSSWLGNKFAAGMKPGPAMRKVSTPRSANPKNFGMEPTEAALAQFIKYQDETLELLQLAAKVDLTKTKTGISLTRFIKLRLCDTLRTVIYHNWRHVLQAERACQLEGEVAG
ncbi:DinB family protein [Lewinella sp. 4G2]|uniref:DinB family protein n=1 Tax=Lewinella sp. 4G2 TaxID=1803372 RepID=UPI0007B4C5DE|nr:DinB family protein [Lewinella sp. 4G2]OAV43462.1 hypothetical protein A3850_002655 [Lewinella sp. 4G2]